MTACHPPDAPEHAKAFAYVCCDCGAEDPCLFACSASRDAWRESHTALTGHARYLVGDLPRPKDWASVMVMTPKPRDLRVPDGHHVAMDLGPDKVRLNKVRLRCSCGVDVTAPFGRAPRSWYGPGQRLLDEAHACT